MQSFRTEFENPIVEKDIIELANKIELFHNGKIDEEKFRSLRLARGVYGQRQEGVQMIRIKLPYGKVKSNQLHRISDVSDEYSRGRLHITTRQDIQIHYVDLNRTPELWAELEKDDVTLREACGNTVRNVTASETAGIDIDEPFDVSPYADALYKFFLRNPICQEMGRKFKVSFSSSDEDTGLSYMHDLGFIAKIKNGERGFKVMIGGGLGSQPRIADVLYDFLPTDKIIPVMEGALRIFDRHGERKSRAKARMKFLIKDIGLDAFKALVEAEQNAIEFKSVAIDVDAYEASVPVTVTEIPEVSIKDQQAFETWKSTNLMPQKQEGYVAIGIKVLLGDFYTDKARLLADLVENYAAGEIRLSLRQNIVIPFVKRELIPFFYTELEKLGFVEAGYNKAIDITACPGTDTCNLGIASSTGISVELERMLKEEYPQYLKNEDLVIKISGCMNACGQHNMANIGFQGMTVRTPDKLVAPALQVLLGGGNLGDGNAAFADKVVKVPSKRGPEALRLILNDFEANANGKPFVEYYKEKGEKYFYDFLSDLQDVTNLTQEDFIDWGEEEKYVKEIGIGECAGVVIDLIATLFLESEEKIGNAKESFDNKVYSSAIYHAYSSLVNSAKALLLAENKKTNTHAGIISQFDELFIESGSIDLGASFSELIYQINKFAPTKDFATKYIENANQFLEKVRAYRETQTKLEKKLFNKIMSINNPKLTVVGAGPGDEDLITLKAIKAIESANVILYDALINESLLKYASEDTELIFVGKRRGCYAFQQEQINELIVTKAKAKGHVVRLKGGDPFIFGRGAEEIDYAREFGIETYVVPGISSALAVPAYQGIPLTKRGASESFWVVTATTKDHALSSDVELAAKSTATIVILMGMHKLSEIVKVFYAENKRNTPVAIIQNGTRDNENVGVGTIRNIQQVVKEKQLAAPAIIVIGDVVKERATLDSISKEVVEQ